MLTKTIQWPPARIPAAYKNITTNLWFNKQLARAFQLSKSLKKEIYEIAVDNITSVQLCDLTVVADEDPSKDSTTCPAGSIVNEGENALSRSP